MVRHSPPGAALAFRDGTCRADKAEWVGQAFDMAYRFGAAEGWQHNGETLNRLRWTGFSAPSTSPRFPSVRDRDSQGDRSGRDSADLPSVINTASASVTFARQIEKLKLR